MGLKIAIFEDDKDLAKVLKERLDSQGYETVLAISGWGTGFVHQLVKPFTIDELEEKMFEVMKKAGHDPKKLVGDKKKGLLSKIFGG